MNKDMVKNFTYNTPLLTIWQYQIWVTPEIHTSIWTLSINHLLTVELLEEGIKERNQGLTSMSGHKFNPSLHPWLSRWRQTE